jgi:alpha-L-arabinofuranosidase
MQFSAWLSSPVVPNVRRAPVWAGMVLVMNLFGLALVPDGMAADSNFIPNGSFEAGGGARIEGWRRQTWAGGGTFTHATEGRTGQRSALLASESGGDLSWTSRVTVEPHARYRLSGWIKTEQLAAPSARGALLNVHNLQGVATRALQGTTDWTRVEVEFDLDDQDSLEVNCLFGGWGQATGKAWFDDVALEKIGDRPRPAPGIVIDAATVSEPMAPEIYSQFIEHLGRCIYGGIWAEMLEDRKFFHPITADYRPYRSLRDTAYPVVGASPWEILGPADKVTMVREDAFVGRHTPRLEAGAAVRQRDLGVTAGKTYAGYAWLKPLAANGADVEVTLRWGSPASDHQSVQLQVRGNDYQHLPFRLVAGATTDRADLELRVSGGPVLVGTVSLMPGDHVEGMRADTLALLRQLRAPIYRWPGGNFVSGYDWRDGIGDRDRRPPRTNPAWTGVEHNDFGMHEFVRFCQLVEAEPWITVNTGFGDAHSAAAQLEYCNGSASTYWGGRRAAHGAPEPFGVRYWGVGNEMWGTWQLGYMQLNHYVIKQNWVVDTMRQVDPAIITIASGDAGPWSTGMLKNCADHMDYLAEHFYCQERPGLMAHVRQIPDNIRRKAEFHRQARRDLPELAGKDIRISMTEWNYWYGPHLFGELGTRYFLKDGLGIAAGIHEYARQSDIIASAFYAQTVNVIGCIKVSRRNAAFETTGLVLKLYRDQFGSLPVKTTATGPVDVQAAWSPDRRTLTIGVVNASLEPLEIPLALTGATLKGSGRAWYINGSDPMAFNDPDTAPDRIQIQESEVAGIRDRLSVKPCSVTVFALPVQ